MNWNGAFTPPLRKHRDYEHRTLAEHMNIYSVVPLLSDEAVEEIEDKIQELQEEQRQLRAETMIEAEAMLDEAEELLENGQEEAAEELIEESEAISDEPGVGGPDTIPLIGRGEHIYVVTMGWPTNDDTPPPKYLYFIRGDKAPGKDLAARQIGDWIERENAIRRELGQTEITDTG